MASQAASTAGSAVAASGAAAAGAAPPAGGEEAQVAQVVTAVAVATTVAATAAAFLFTDTSNVPVEPAMNATHITTCWPAESPQFRKGSFTMFLEDFPCSFTDRESRLIDNIVVEAYNDVYYVEEQGCVDEYFQEMLDSTLIQQLFTPAIDNSLSILETTFNSWVACKDCPVEEPLFGGQTNGERRLQLENESGFFQEFLSRINIEITALVEVNELPSGYVQIAIAYVEDNNQKATTIFVVESKDIVLLAEVLPPTDPTSPSNPMNPSTLALLPPSDPSSPSNPIDPASLAQLAPSEPTSPSNSINPANLGELAPSDPRSPSNPISQTQMSQLPPSDPSSPSNPVSPTQLSELPPSDPRRSPLSPANLQTVSQPGKEVLSQANFQVNIQANF
jgi:hypothetical protein